ncbi:hypothetical protein R3P38DRAFT_2789339 [Favolaschia claudopus]|uniref:F-box domain-containing protein n=1 Tax=Favolaschia claudopus TaxID=2862362 RepID=A0AAW0AKQ8_9AGAR
MNESLAPEIFQAILLQVVDPRDPKQAWVEIVDQRRTLCYVSKYWEKMVAGFSELWTPITIQRFTTPSLLSRCLKCCGEDRVIDITMDLGAWKVTAKDKVLTNVKSVPMDQFLEMIDGVLMPFANRIASMSVENEKEREVSMVANMMAEHSWPRLQKLALKPSWYDGSPRRAFALPQVHQINDFQLDIISPRQVPISIFPTLHILALRESLNGHWNAFEVVIRQLTDIRQLKLDKVTVTRPHPNIAVRMADTLHTLHFYYENTGQAEILGALDISRLDRLSIRAYDNGDLRDAITSNPSVFAHSREISICQRNDDTQEGTFAALVAMRDVVCLDMGLCGSLGVEALKEFVRQGRELSSLENVDCGGVFNAQDMEYIAGGRFAQNFRVMQHGQVVGKEQGQNN